MAQRKKSPDPIGVSSAGQSFDFGGKILLIEARYYGDIADEMMAGAIAELDAHGAAYDRVTVPGALEIPQALAAAAPLFPDIYVGAVALGCVIRGDTSHYEVVVHNSNYWLMDVAINAGIPVGNGILTVENKAQALERAQGGRAGKGGDAARACLSLILIEQKFTEPAQ
ncbi:MAG: 6,7-dimethyl-8-ribityllumazine synthase [Hyphomicrobiaceae bacterium]|nr:6,7-dimethyl-8-ribityllumazine synthase [Hyphomicrobiaceae bacterium]